MNTKLVIAEKPSVAQSIAAVIGAKTRRDGYLEGNGYLVSWCFGHLAELAEPEQYDEKYGKWRYDDLPILPPWSQKDMLAYEKELIGFYISGHPLNSYEAELKGLFEVGKLNENPEQYDKQEVTVGGLIVEKTDRITRRNDVMSIIRLEDFSGSASCDGMANHRTRNRLCCYRE